MRIDDGLAARHRGVVDDLKAAGQYKVLQPVSSPMGPAAVVGGRDTIVLCSNDYLSLANHPNVVAAGVDGLHKYGAGTASVRFICGTLDVHVGLEHQIADLVGCDEALTFVSCWNANEAVFPTLAAPGDRIISDALNHASIIDSIRAARGVDYAVYPHSDMAALDRELTAASDATVRWVVTDGVFSMEGDVARLPEIVALCERHNARLVVDDSHGIGVAGATGRGVIEHFGLIGSVDIVTGTLGKALGGAAGGFVAASGDMIELLVQRARPSLFSNALPATVAASASKAIEVMLAEPDRVARLHHNAGRLRAGLRDLGYPVVDTPSAIIPIVLDSAPAVVAASRDLMAQGVMVVGFSFPVVPKDSPRLRVQASAGLTDAQIDQAISAFEQLRRSSRKPG